MAFSVPPGKELAFYPTQFLKEMGSGCAQGVEEPEEFDFAFCMEEAVRDVPPFYHFDGPISPCSKVPRQAVPRLCLAFCWPKRVDEAASLTGFSAQTVKGLYLTLSQLLIDPRYRKWHAFDRQDWFATGVAYYYGAPWQMIWDSYAVCYANQDCQRNFRYGRRRKRQCARCPAADDPLRLLEDTTQEYRNHWLRIVDETRHFYLNRLGIKNGDMHCDIFQRHVYHQQVINRARYHSRVRRHGRRMVNHLKRGSSTVFCLWETLLNHIAEYGGLDQAVGGTISNLRKQ